jgi:excisionase family DNA binding protein
MRTNINPLSVTEAISYTGLSSKPLSVTEAADYTGLSKTYLYKLIHLKKITRYKPNNGKVYFRKEDLDAYIFSGKVSADCELREQAEQLLIEQRRVKP